MRWPGARMAPTTSNWACRHTRDENSGANGARRVIISAGRVIIGNLFSQEWLPRLSCFPPLTQMAKVYLRALLYNALQFTALGLVDPATLYGIRCRLRHARHSGLSMYGRYVPFHFV